MISTKRKGCVCFPKAAGAVLLCGCVFCMVFALTIFLHAFAVKSAASEKSISQTSPQQQTQSGTASASPAIPETLQTPVIVGKTAGEGYALLVWKPVEGAQGYEVWRKKNGEFKRAAKLKGMRSSYYVNLKAKPGRNYVYRVRAISADRGKSPYSKKIRLRIRLGTPVIRSLKKRKISWHRVRGAKRYIVYMKKSKEGKWKKIGSTKKTRLGR